MNEIEIVEEEGLVTEEEGNCYTKNDINLNFMNNFFKKKSYSQNCNLFLLIHFSRSVERERPKSRDRDRERERNKRDRHRRSYSRSRSRERDTTKSNVKHTERPAITGKSYIFRTTILFVTIFPLPV